MGVLSRLSSVASRPSLRAGTPSPLSDFWYSPEGFLLAANTGRISSDLALTLSYVYCAVDIISSDFGSMTCQMFRDLGEDNGRERVKFSDPGIGALAYRLRWKPNQWQTAKAFWSTLAWQYLLRPAAYAELIYRPNTDSFVDDLIPRHPDRVKEEVLPITGRLRYQLQEPDGRMRSVTQDEMLVVRNTSMDGLNSLGRLWYGSSAITAGLALQDFTRNYFRKGATASLMATYKGANLEPEAERDLHGSISRYLSGVENAGGLLLVPADIDVKTLGVDPEKAELVGLKNLSGRDIARMWKMPPSWLGIEDSQSYGSQVQDATNYVNRVQIPMVVEFEQAVHRDLIVATQTYFIKFNMDYLLRADTKTRMEAHEIAIRNRIYRPSRAQLMEDLPIDRALDKLSESDFRPGQSGGSQPAKADGGRLQYLGALALRDTAAHCLKREREYAEKLAKRVPDNVAAWQDGMRDFFADHAAFVAQRMHLSMETARAYCAQHGAQLEAHGLPMYSEAWERSETDELALLAIAPERQAA